MADIVMEKIAHTDELKAFMEKYGLSFDEVCIVGSAVMAASGIRENDDLEVLDLTEFLVKYGDFDEGQ